MDYEPVMAETYDAVYAQIRDPSGDRDWYRARAVAAGGPALELGCGTGRVLLHVAAAGVEVVGVDPSDAMLGALRAKSPPPNVSTVRATFQTLALDRRDFAFAYAPFRAFQHLLTVDDQLEGLARIRDHLRPADGGGGGRLAFDVFEPNPARIAVAREDEVEHLRFVHQGRTVIRWVSITRDRLTQTMDVVFRFSELDGTTLGVQSAPLRWIWRYELEHLLVRAGFVPESWSSGYDGRPYEARGEIVVVARRA
ncbi:MAG: class I SAM-dependent methyltransferase [Myxococcota bacterium]